MRLDTRFDHFFWDSRQPFHEWKLCTTVVSCLSGFVQDLRGRVKIEDSSSLTNRSADVETSAYRIAPKQYHVSLRSRRLSTHDTK